MLIAVLGALEWLLLLYTAEPLFQVIHSMLGRIGVENIMFSLVVRTTIQLVFLYRSLLFHLQTINIVL